MFSSSSFYVSMIESAKMFEMRAAGQKLQDINLLADDALEKISKTEVSHDVVIEIYSKNKSTNEYTDNVYSKCYHGVMFNETNEHNTLETFNPVIGYSASEFELFQEYEDKTFAGISRNKTTDKSFFVLVTPSDSGDYIFITAVESLMSIQSLCHKTLILASY